MFNVAFIYQPHFKTECFRVAMHDQKGRNNNYIIVTCSPMYNGVWRYSPDNISKYKHWQNGNVDCICVPIKDCIQVKNLEDVTDPTMCDIIKKQQNDWYKSKVKNRNYQYANKPQWIL